MIALSYSRISDFRACPWKYCMKYIKKEPNFQMKQEAKSPAIIRGGNIHAQLESYVRNKLAGKLVELTMPEVIKTAPLIDKIMDNYNVLPEQQISINADFKRVDWYSKDSWFRAIIDLTGFGSDLMLVDWKTGKMNDYEGDMNCLGQLHMSAIVGLSLYPDYDICSCLYWFVDHDKPIQIKFSQSELESMKDKLIEEHALINAETDFDPKKNRYCHFCEATAQQCNYSKK